jgi:hypothetical protein
MSDCNRNDLGLRRRLRRIRVDDDWVDKGVKNGSGAVSGPWTKFFAINQKRAQACKGLAWYQSLSFFVAILFLMELLVKQDL